MEPARISSQHPLVLPKLWEKSFQNSMGQFSFPYFINAVDYKMCCFSIYKNIIPQHLRVQNLYAKGGEKPGLQTLHCSFSERVKSFIS